MENIVHNGDRGYIYTSMDTICCMSHVHLWHGFVPVQRANETNCSKGLWFLPFSTLFLLAMLLSPVIWLGFGLVQSRRIRNITFKLIRSTYLLL